MAAIHLGVVMLETPEERVKLLKAGFTGKTIEKLYIQYNNFKIVCIPDFIELIEFNILQNKRTESTWVRCTYAASSDI